MNPIAEKTICLYKILSTLIESYNSYADIFSPEIDDVTKKVINKYIGNPFLGDGAVLKEEYYPTEMSAILSSIVTGYYSEKEDKFSADHIYPISNLTSSKFYYDLNSDKLYGYFENSVNSGFFRLTTSEKDLTYSYDSSNTFTYSKSSGSVAGKFDLTSETKVIVNDTVLNINTLVFDLNIDVEKIKDGCQYEFELHQAISGQVNELEQKPNDFQVYFFNWPEQLRSEFGDNEIGYLVFDALVENNPDYGMSVLVTYKYLYKVKRR